jgi:DNA (cytosine-5)-methyltransferase 1
MAYKLTEKQREKYRKTSIRSAKRKKMLLSTHNLSSPPSSIKAANRLDTTTLMPQINVNGLSCISLFSGGGGLDLGFERSGFFHEASFEILDICGQTLRNNRPDWKIYSGEESGDVTKISFTEYRGIDVIHGGPPCQPFSIAGKQKGVNDPRNMWPDFVRSILEIKPRAFVAENVPGILDSKFQSFIEEFIINPLDKKYTIFQFKISADDFGVPQARRRVFFVGFRSCRDAKKFIQPHPTHIKFEHLSKINGPLLPKNTARKSLGLPDIGFDDLAPTLRSGFTGPRNTTGVVNSLASMKKWNLLGIWPNGVQPNRSMADTFTPENGNFRLSVADCALLQGFPNDWEFSGAVYQTLGQIGNSVCPPVAYSVARQVSLALRGLK